MAVCEKLGRVVLEIGGLAEGSEWWDGIFRVIGEGSGKCTGKSLGDAV